MVHKVQPKKMLRIATLVVRGEPDASVGFTLHLLREVTNFFSLFTYGCDLLIL